MGRADLLKEYGQKIVLGNCRNFYYISNSSKIKFDLVWKVMRRIITGGSKVQDGLIDPSNLRSSSNSEEELRLPLSAGYNILLSLLVPEPEILDSKWEIEAAVNSKSNHWDPSKKFYDIRPINGILLLSLSEFLSPMLEKIKSFADFSVRSQVLYYIKLNVYPQWNQEKKYHEVPYEQLPLVINPVEAKLSTGFACFAKYF